MPSTAAETSVAGTPLGSNFATATSDGDMRNPPLTQSILRYFPSVPEQQARTAWLELFTRLTHGVGSEQGALKDSLLEEDYADYPEIVTGLEQLLAERDLKRGMTVSAIRSGVYRALLDSYAPNMVSIVTCSGPRPTAIVPPGPYQDRYHFIPDVAHGSSVHTRPNTSSDLDWFEDRYAEAPDIYCSDRPDWRGQKTTTRQKDVNLLLNRATEKGDARRLRERTAQEEANQARRLAESGSTVTDEGSIDADDGTAYEEGTSYSADSKTSSRSSRRVVFEALRSRLVR